MHEIDEVLEHLKRARNGLDRIFFAGEYKHPSTHVALQLSSQIGHIEGNVDFLKTLKSQFEGNAA